MLNLHTKAISRHQKTQPIITEIALRAQITEAAIATIAEIGYSEASFSQIAKTAALTNTGLLSYHFASKQELNVAIVEEVIGTMPAFMHGRMQVVSTPRGALVAYIEGTIAFTHGGFA